jgi:hypothetical protein
MPAVTYRTCHASFLYGCGKKRYAFPARAESAPASESSHRSFDLQAITSYDYL